MTARGALTIIAALAIAAALALWHSHRDRRDHSHAALADTTEPRAAPRASDDVATARSEHLAAPERDLIDRDPESAARIWDSRTRHVLRAKNRKEFGDEVARLMELPYDQAWGPLVERAKDGDVHAAVALGHIQSLCYAVTTGQNVPRRTQRPASSFYKELPDAIKPFIDRIAELHTEDYERRVAHCGGVGNALDVGLMLLDRFLRPENPEAQVEIAADNEDKSQAIADLRGILAKHDLAHGRFVLGDLLMQSSDADERAEGRSMLEKLAPDDTEAASRLAICLQHGCGDTAPDPAAARPWLELSAGLGDALARAELEHALRDGGDRAAAWAWSLYALDLALDGCFEMFSPSHIFVASAARDEARNKAGLTPAEQNAGLAISYAIAGRWEKAAKERLSCD